MIISFPSVSTLSHTYAHIHSLSITRCPIQKFFSDPIALSIIKSNNHRAMIHTCITGRYASHMMPTLSMIGRTSTCSIGPSIYSLRIERICFLLCRAHHYECIGANSLSLSLSLCVCVLVHCQERHSTPHRTHRIIRIDVNHVDEPLPCWASVEILLSVEQIADLVVHAITERTR